MFVETTLPTPSAIAVAKSMDGVELEPAGGWGGGVGGKSAGDIAGEARGAWTVSSAEGS